MRILSVIPSEHNGPNSTVILAVKDGKYLRFVYSETYELLHDPNNPTEWCQWNGGSLTEAIQWVIDLPGDTHDKSSIYKVSAHI
jgi:hypothetical protein